MAIQGLRDTSNFVAEQRPKNWRETVLLLYPNGKAPLTAFTSLMKTKATDDPEFNWWEKIKPTQRSAISANLTDVATSISVASGAYAYGVGHILRIEETGELVRVNAAAASDIAVTVSRGFAGTTATAVTIATAGVNPNFHVVSTVFEEGSAAPSGINYDPTKKYNYTEIQRNTLEMTRTASKTRLRTGDAVKEAKRECLELHTCEMEKQFIFGIKTETTINGKPARMTGGIISFIDSGNIVTCPAAGLDMEQFEDYMAAIFRYGSQEKLGFGGNEAMLAVQRMARRNSSYQFMQGQKEFGVNVSRLTSPFGDLVLKTHPLFNELSSGVTTAVAYNAVASWLLIIDADELVYRPLDDTTYQKQLQDNGLDSVQSGYLTESGLEIHHPLSHYLIKGLRTGVVDTP